MTYDEDEKALEAKLMALNLKRIERLSRRGLLVFLDQEASKSNTKRLRVKARLIAIEQGGFQTNDELTHAENFN